MTKSTKLGWENGLHTELVELTHRYAKGQIKEKEYAPEPFITKADFARIQNAFDEAKALLEFEYSDLVIKSNSRSMWPFNDSSIKLPPKFEAVYMEIYNYHILQPYSDDAVKEQIEQAGGRPYDSRGYGKNDYGDLVTDPDKKIIAAKLGCTEKTITREINKMVTASILVPLKTARNKPSMYVIGTLGRAPGNRHQRMPFINRTADREAIKQALAQL